MRILRKEGNTTLYLLNRSEKHGKQLADKHNAFYHHLTSLKEVIGRSEVILSCTSANNTIIIPADVPEGRRYFIDLAVPGDIDKAIGTIEGVKLFTIDDVERSIGNNKARREKELVKAEKIIQEQAKEFMEWQFDQKFRISTIQNKFIVPENVNL